MRWLLFTIMGFALILGFSYYATYQITQSAQIVQNQLLEAEKQIAAGQWDKATEQVETVYHSWSNMKRWWGMLVNHNTIQAIDIAIKRFEQYALTREKSHSLAELHTLIILLNDVTDSETLKAINIL